MDDHTLAKHGHFAQELEDLQRLGDPAERMPEPESTALNIMAFAAMNLLSGGLILGSVALLLLGFDILLFNEFAVLPVVLLPLVALWLIEARRPVLPEPGVLRGMSDKTLSWCRGACWCIALTSYILHIVWMTWDRAVPLLAEAKQSGDVGLLVNSGLAFLAVATACVPLILCQMAVEARQRRHKAA